MSVVRKNITITDEQAEYIRDKNLSLSRFVQDKLDEKMEVDPQNGGQ